MTVNIGNVITQKIVETRTTFALNSCSVLNNSANVNMTEAQGAPDKINIEALNSSSKNGKK